MRLADIKAQDTAHTVLEHALRRGRLAHAYLFVGPSGVGKQHMAIALAKAALCGELPGEGCEHCESCRRISEGAHPDVRVLLPRAEGNKNLPVDLIREEVLPFAKFAPFEAAAAFIIFPHADLSFPMQHAEGANAILKTLEEPRRNVHFVLTSERPDRLLQTIRSRCQRVRFGRLPNKVVEEILAAHDVPPEAAGPAIALSRGRADLALELATEDGAGEMLRHAQRIDAVLSGDAPVAAVLELAEELARSERRAAILDSLELYYRDVAVCGLGLPAQALAFQSSATGIAQRSDSLAPAAAAGRVAQLQQLARDFERNANAELALDAALLAMAAVR